MGQASRVCYRAETGRTEIRRESHGRARLRDDRHRGARTPRWRPAPGSAVKVGFIGVGSIGRPMAGQLLRAGHQLAVHDMRREHAEPLIAAGARWAESPAAVAADCEVVATCLPGPVEMEQVVLGPRGILETMQPGALYIDHTTN